jgi:hypothetical protein
LICFTKRADFITSFDFLRAFWEVPFVDDRLIRQRFCGAFFGKLMIVFLGDPRLLDYINWNLLKQFAEDEETCYLACCILHQMTLVEPAVQSALDHGILDFCQRMFARGEYQVIVVGMGLMKNLLFVTTVEQLKLILFHEVMSGLFNCLCQCEVDFARAILASIIRAIREISNVVGVTELTFAWESLGIFRFLADVSDQDELTEKVDDLLNILGCLN